METVNRSERDGATVLISPSTVLTMTRSSRPTTLDSASAPLTVAGIGGIPFAFVVGPAAPDQVRTLSAYFAWVKANPASNTCCVPGFGPPLTTSRAN